MGDTMQGPSDPDSVERDIYIYIHTHTYIYTYIHRYTHTYTQAYTLSARHHTFEDHMSSNVLNK